MWTGTAIAEEARKGSKLFTAQCPSSFHLESQTVRINFSFSLLSFWVLCNIIFLKYYFVSRNRCNIPIYVLYLPIKNLWTCEIKPGSEPPLSQVPQTQPQRRGNGPWWSTRAWSPKTARSSSKSTLIRLTWGLYRLHWVTKTPKLWGGWCGRCGL